VGEQEPELVKMSELSRRAGVPASTIKHYIREGLLPAPAKRTNRNMAYYDAELVGRIRTIKSLQQSRFLPLRLIKKLIATPKHRGEEAIAADVVLGLLEGATTGETRTRGDLIGDDHPEWELDAVRELGLVQPRGTPPDEAYGGGDLALLAIIRDARQAGLSAEMLPTDILEAYLQAIRELVHIEVQLLRVGILPRANGRTQELTEAAVKLSERLVLQLRRQALKGAVDQLGK